MSRGGLRIVGGRWRGRRLRVPEAAGLRPTADRVRETLCNWLQADLPGARVLDLFAGSGALGLEALSRGAAEVVFVERSRRVADALRANLALLGEDGRATVVHGEARRYLTGAGRPFDAVFLDPPFRSAIIGPVLVALDRGAWIAEGGRVYVEFDRHSGPPVLPAGWGWLREKAAGGVGYGLVAPGRGAVPTDGEQEQGSDPWV